MAMASTDPRDSDPPDAAERPSSVAILAACTHCGQEPQHRRGLGRRCYRKLKEANWPLPDARPPGPAPGTGQGDPIQQWTDRLSDQAKMKLLRALLGPLVNAGMKLP